MLHEKININVDYKKLGLDNNGFQPTLHTYVLDNSPSIDASRIRKAVVICPGGAYEFTSDREGEAIAIRLNSMGYQAFVLRYSTAPADFPVALYELATAMAIVRENSKQWHVDPNKIVVGGFSAGGHLAGCLGMLWNKGFIEKELGIPKEMFKPNGMLLSYPVITSKKFAHRNSFINLLGKRYDELIDKASLEDQVSENTPPAFIWHTYNDQDVPVENSLLLVASMKKYNIPLELHIYPHGTHGLGLASYETAEKDCEEHIQYECQNWIDMFGVWLRNL